MNTRNYQLRSAGSQRVRSGGTLRMDGVPDELVFGEIERIRHIAASPYMNYRLGIAVVLDYSGSMAPFAPLMKVLLKELIQQLQLIDHRDFTLAMVLIHNSMAKTVYFGDVKDIDADALLAALPPEPYGATPYASALSLAAQHMDELYNAMEMASQWYNACPLYLSITDAMNNQNEDLEVASRMSRDFLSGTCMIAEFVTEVNQDGFCPGGFKIRIDRLNAEDQIKSFLRAVQIGSSTIGTAASCERMPDDFARQKKNRYLGDYLFAEVTAWYDRYTHDAR